MSRLSTFVLIIIACLAAIPGTYTGPASRAYLYYTPELKTWQSGIGATIKPGK